MTVSNNNEMTPLQRAREEWEANTTPHPKKHPLSEFRPVFHTQEFRQFGQAIAWLEWDGKYIEIKKIEKLPCAGKGAGTPLVEFLKLLAEKYQVRIFGKPIRYDPDPPVPCGPLLTQNQLGNWYEKHGFHLCKILESGIPISVEMWYPDTPPPKL